MDTLRSLYSRTIDKEEAGQAKSDTDHLTDRKQFPVKQDSHSDENDSQTDVGYQGSQADVPASPVHQDVTQFQTDDDDTQDHRSPIGHSELIQKTGLAFKSSGEKIRQQEK